MRSTLTLTNYVPIVDNRARETRRLSSSLHSQAGGSSPQPQQPAQAIQPIVGQTTSSAQQQQQQQQQQLLLQKQLQMKLDNHLDDETMHRLTVDTLEELDWCLDQLEAIQSHRSVGDLATIKFKRMLNKELSHFGESKSGSQISGYIRSFLGE